MPSIVIFKFSILELWRKKIVLQFGFVYTLFFLIPAIFIWRDSEMAEQLRGAAGESALFVLDILLILFFFWAAGFQSNDIHQRAYAALFSRPVSRLHFLSGRVLALGVAYLVFASFVLLSALGAELAMRQSVSWHVLAEGFQNIFTGLSFILIAFSLGFLLSRALAILSIVSFVLITRVLTSLPETPFETLNQLKDIAFWIAPPDWITSFDSAADIEKFRWSQFLMNDGPVMIGILSYGLCFFALAWFLFSWRDLPIKGSD